MGESQPREMGSLASWKYSCALFPYPLPGSQRRVTFSKGLRCLGLGGDLGSQKLTEPNPNLPRFLSPTRPFPLGDRDPVLD